GLHAVARAAAVAAAVARDHDPVDVDGSVGDPAALLPREELYLPDLATGQRVECDHRAVTPGRVDPPVADCDARLPAPGPHVEALWVRGLVVPEGLAGRGIHGVDVALRILDVIRAGVDDRVRLERAARGVHRRAVALSDVSAEVDVPRLLERAHVRRRDLRQRRVAVALEVAHVR